MEKKISIKIPIVPNYFFDEKGTQYSVTEFTDEELKKIGEEWTQALIKKRTNQNSLLNQSNKIKQK